ncbi:MAG: S-layer homology domain-containing protein [Anaerotignum sp.]|nr:S-layer homology domain-containing protein [Anaerotignum sp.]
MKKRFFSILLCFCMVLGLLPVIALAADPVVTIGSTTLVDGKYYTVIDGDDSSNALVNQLDEPPTDDTPYLSFSGGILTVTGDVSLTNAGNSPLRISNDKLTIAGSGSLSLSCSGDPTVAMNNDASLFLAESVNFSAEATGSAPAFENGAVETEEDYLGDITISSTASNAILYTLVNLQTSGDISISNESFSTVISTFGTVTLKGKTVDVSSTNGNLIEIVPNLEIPDEPAISITATESDLTLTGTSSDPLLAADHITLSANGNIQVENTGNVGNSIAIVGNLTVTEAQDVTVSSSHALAIAGAANITATGDVFISSTNGFAVNGLTVNGANNVTVTAVGSSAPAIMGDVAINASGDIDIQNTGDGMAISANNVSAVNVSVDTTGGGITVQSGGTAPVIDANTAITLKAMGNIEVTGPNSSAALEATSKTLTSTNGVIKLTDKNGTSMSITLADGSTISAADGGNASTGLDLATTTLTVDTYYQAGDGYALWKDITGNATDGYTATLVLHNTTIENTTALIGGGVRGENMGIALPKGNITLQVEGENEISSQYGHGIGVYNGNITLSGDGTLNVSGDKNDIDLNTGYTLTFENSDVKLNGIVTISGENDSSSAVYGDVTVGQYGLILYGDVTIATGATLTIPEGKILNLTGGKLVTNNGQIINNGEIQLSYSDYDAAEIKALRIGGSGKIILFYESSKYIYIDNNIYYNDGVFTSNELTINAVPDGLIYMEVGDGYITSTPQTGETPATLTLHDVVLTSLTLPNAPLMLSLGGENEIFHINAYNAITVSGSGSLDTYLFVNDDATAALTIDDGAKFNTLYETVADDVTTITIYGSYTVSSYYGLSVSPTAKVVLSPGAVMTLGEEGHLDFNQNALLNDLTIGTGASIVNNTYIILPQGTTEADIVALPLSGTGIVRVATEYNADGWAAAWDTYTNDGTPLREIGGGLTLSSTEVGADEAAGFTWTEATEGGTTVWTFSLDDNTYIQGDISLIAGTIVIDSGTNRMIGGSINANTGQHCNITFAGEGSLTANGIRGSNIDGDIVTVTDGADVTIHGSIFIGASGGANGTLNVIGTGTSLNASSLSGYAIGCDTINVDDRGSLIVTSQGDDSMGIQALTGVNVRGGSTLTAGCDYGVYIDGGALTVDSTSKLVTNGAVAPFCIVGAGNSEQNDVLSLGVALPSGTKIASKQATNGSGVTHNYWSLVPTGGSLNVSNTDNSPVTLTGAAKGLLTFVKAASNPIDGGGGGASLTRTLTFKTNGGSEIASVSKTSGTAIELKSYKPTRDGYTFAGWYTDEALTKKITSVTLTTSMTVYAKWTEDTVPVEETKETKNPFTDVKDSDYFYDAVEWAVEKDITSGTTSGSFSPSNICTRAQMVTFLWKAMGSPEPTAVNCPFTDVSKQAYYFKAVLWAVENDITSGATATTFAPNKTVTRGQTVTFLWRGAGKPMATIANPYTDVVKDAYNYNAILWAAEKGITQGTSATTFSPDTPCTRGQIVTFLYKYMGK